MGLGPDLGAGSHGPVSKSTRTNLEDPSFVRLTLRPLRSEERVHLAVESGARVGDVRRLIEQKFGVASPAKVLRFTKQRTYVKCEDNERITRDRVLHLKDVEWLQNPSAPSTSLVANNPEAFVDRPRPKKPTDVQPEADVAREPVAKVQSPADEAWRDLRNFKDKFGHYRVVHTHVWVRAAPNLEARRLGLLPHDSIVSGHVLDNWLLLDGPSRMVTGEEIAKSGPAWALVDGREMGYSVLLERQETDKVSAASTAGRSAELHNELVKERRKEKASSTQAASSSAPPVASAVPATALAPAVEFAGGAQGASAAAWLLLPPEAAEDETRDLVAGGHTEAAAPAAAKSAMTQAVAPEVSKASSQAPASSSRASSRAEAAEHKAQDVVAGGHAAAAPVDTKAEVQQAAASEGLEAPRSHAAAVPVGAQQQAPGSHAAAAPVGAKAEAPRSHAAALPVGTQQRAPGSHAAAAPVGAKAEELLPTARAVTSAVSSTPEQQGMDAMFGELSSRLSLIKEDSNEVLKSLLCSEGTRKQAKEVLELLYSFERLRELRTAHASTGSTPSVPVPGPPAVPEETVHLSPAAHTDDPLRLRQVFTTRWRYGEWHQDTDKFRQRTPFGMLRGALQEDLLAYLVDRAPFNAVSEEAHMALRRTYRMGKEKFEGRTDFVKADWHTVPGLPEVAEVFIPRHGARGPALRAPDHVTAFAAAFRSVNSSVWEALASRLRGGLAPRGKEELEGLGGFFANALDEGRHFGAAELQHFWGEGFDGKMHVDGTTSTLHLAVSLSGKRRLHVRSALNKTTAECQQDVYEMLPGDVYLSSPATFQHQVSYPTCDFKNAMASLHMRFLFEPHWWLKKWVNHTRDMDMREINSAVADVLHNHRIRLPTLAEVKDCEASLRVRKAVRKQ